MKVSIGDVSLYFDSIGSGLWPEGNTMRERPTLVFVHGGPGFDHSYFKPFFGALADEMQIVFYDQRGNGRSDLSSRAFWNIDVWADDLNRFLTVLGIVRPIVLGNSFGGMVAQRFAGTHPDRLSGLILSSTAATCPYDHSVEAFRRLGGDVAADAAKQFFDDPAAVGGLEHYSNMCFPYYSREGWNANISSRAIPNLELLTYFFANEMRTLDLRESLQLISVPTVIMVGADDPITPLPKAREMFAEVRPGIAALRVYEESRHLLDIDEPERMLADVRTFVRDTFAGG
jgi:pimeloyl-ACP methyl ester carboxylesterase